MITEKDKKEIVACIHDKYTSLDTPDFSFVRETLASQPYAKVLQQIAHDFTLEEETDTNDDVSFGYVLTKQQQRWVLRLSMVGPYAVLLRLESAANTHVVSPMMPGLSAAETALSTLLSKENIRLLDRETLCLPIPLQLFNTDPENTRLYQALFTDSDILPWEAPSPQG